MHSLVRTSILPKSNSPGFKKTFSTLEIKKGAGSNATSNNILQDVNSSTAIISKPAITLADFAKLDIKVAKIIHSEPVEGADKLLKITLDIGDNQFRTIFSGIKSAYNPNSLIGRKTLYLANLQPRKMRFGVSEGMILAASDPQGKSIFLTNVDDGAETGMQIS